MFSKHEPVYINLLPDGKWDDPDSGPMDEKTASARNIKWAKVESYLEFFKYCSILIDEKLIDRDRFNLMYGGQIKYILKNNQISQRIQEKQQEWSTFIDLSKKLGYWKP